MVGATPFPLAKTDAAPGLVGLFLALVGIASAAQDLPPPRDGDIRVIYWELRGETEVWLTLEPRSPRGEKLPISLTLSVGFPGKRPATPVTQAEVRAHVNLLWAPRPQLTLVVDGQETVDFVPPGPTPQYATSGQYWDSPMIGMAGTISIAALKRMAAARSLGGNALRLDFELDDAQRAAVGRFAERALSPDPASASGLR